MEEDYTRAALWSPQTTAQFLGRKVSVLAYWRGVGSGPLFIRVGKHVRYRPADVQKWLAEREARSTSTPKIAAHKELAKATQTKLTVLEWALNELELPFEGTASTLLKLMKGREVNFKSNARGLSAYLRAHATDFEQAGLLVIQYRTSDERLIRIERETKLQAETEKPYWELM